MKIYFLLPKTDVADVSRLPCHSPPLTPANLFFTQLIVGTFYVTQGC